MPAGAKVLHVGLQQHQPTVWALCDAEAGIEDRSFRVAGTGHPISATEIDRYVGTFMMAGDSLVWHLFEQPSVAEARMAGHWL